ncbi:MAG TPA: hypothetical protein VFM80_03635 [Gracilimonas sp.]|uniref:hypothetical protein n=1 Tax=Gracilimonas sp. TaxID=1974203 RepID=UPI002DA2FD53|nr:hypothetical protein [Gracilimonas sp.]
MKNKELDIVKTIRTIRDKNYEKTKELSREELLDWYQKQRKEAMKKFSRSSQGSKLTE